MVQAVAFHNQVQNRESPIPETGSGAWLYELIDYFGLDFFESDNIRRKLIFALNREISRIDDVITDQVNSVIHHEQFQSLESIWQGVRYLVESIEDPFNVKVKALDVAWSEIAKDLDRAIEVDQSEIFNKVYHQEFGAPGGEPFGVLLGNYQVTHLSRISGQDDI
ncbi:MAG: type VI secretion system contractile sheath large subunit, partial [Chromatiales bacterium]|nr:type VI secretion system contractile sheath large subunit [Chromatiales bacterium]